MSRTVVRVEPIVASITGYLDDECAFPVVRWTRPQDPNEKYIDPPYASTRIYPSAEEFGGPLSDSQADVNVRFQVLGIGKTSSQALVVLDIVRVAMHADLRASGLRTIVADRVIRNIKLMVAHGGEVRENDLPTPWFYAMDLYEINTTPA